VPQWIEAVNDIRRRVGAVSNTDARFTWLIRVDRKMEAACRDAAWALRRFMPEWSKAQERGDELGWILCPAYQAGDEWRQAYGDEGQLVELVEEGWEAFRSAATAPRTMLMGWRGHRQRSMQRINELGVRVDLSALPGWYTETRLGVAPPLGACDWEVTPAWPYHPSSSDYRRPIVYRGDPALDLLEVPVTLAQSRLGRLRASLADLLKGGNLGLTRNYRRRRQGLPLKLDDAPDRFRRLAGGILSITKPDTFALSFVCPAATLLSKAAIDHVSRNLSWLSTNPGPGSAGLTPVTAREAYRSLTGGRLRMVTVEESCGHAHAHH
jgi:hypothetical protein